MGERRKDLSIWSIHLLFRIRNYMSKEWFLSIVNEDNIGDPLSCEITRALAVSEVSFSNGTAH